MRKSSGRAGKKVSSKKDKIGNRDEIAWRTNMNSCGDVGRSPDTPTDCPPCPQPCSVSVEREGQSCQEGQACTSLLSMGGKEKEKKLQERQ